jgi:CheY-like chemotaxis protein
LLTIKDVAASQTIMLVEDDPSTRALMETWLDTEGYDVRTASNGREALRFLKEEPPFLMVVDLNMPVMDGAELRREQLRLPSLSAIPFILVSAADNAARVALELGIDDVIAKPFDADRLLRLIASYCDGGGRATPHPAR